MKYKFIEESDALKKTEICEKVLKELPLWFGIPESTQEYCRDVQKYPFYKVITNDLCIGFISLKQNNEYVSEIYVIGILPEYHKQGLGAELIKYTCKLLKRNKVKYLEVKTLAADKESEEYRRTRLFYKKVGFIPFDVLFNEWGEANPCLIMIKRL